MVDHKDESGAPNSLANALRTIRAYWAELRPLLDERAVAKLADALADRDEDPVVVAAEVKEIIKARTPRDHPARPALLPMEHRLVTSLAPAPEVASLLMDLNILFRSSGLIPGPLRRGADGRSDPGPLTPLSTDGKFAHAWEPVYVADEHDQWLLDEPSVPMDAIRWDDSWARDIVVLRTADGKLQVPTFQFDGPQGSPGSPRGIVLDVNRKLSADADPWGVADWWLGSNVWLPAPPARLLGTKDESRITTALRAVLAEW